MLGLLFPQLALATAATFGGLASTVSDRYPLSLLPSLLGTLAVVAGPNDRTALDILNNTRPDILAHGAKRALSSRDDGLCRRTSAARPSYRPRL